MKKFTLSDDTVRKNWLLVTSRIKMVNDRRINYYKVQANTFARINFLKFL